MRIWQKCMCIVLQNDIGAPLIIALNEENHGEPSDCRNEKWPILEVLHICQFLASIMSKQVYSRHSAYGIVATFE